MWCGIVTFRPEGIQPASKPVLVPPTDALDAGCIPSGRKVTIPHQQRRGAIRSEPSARDPKSDKPFERPLRRPKEETRGHVSRQGHQPCASGKWPQTPRAARPMETVLARWLIPHKMQPATPLPMRRSDPEITKTSGQFRPGRIRRCCLDFMIKVYVHQLYNFERTHQGKICCGRGPIETMIDGKEIWQENFVN